MSDVPTRVDESDRAASPADVTETSDSETIEIPGDTRFLVAEPPTSNTDSPSPEHDDEFIHCDLDWCIMGEMNEDVQRRYKVYLGTGNYDRARTFRDGRYTAEEKQKINDILLQRMPERLEPAYKRSRIVGKSEEQKCETKKSQARTEENTSPRPRLGTCLFPGPTRPEPHKQRCHCQQKLRTGDFDDRKRFRPGDKRAPDFTFRTCINCGCKEAFGAEECCVLIDKTRCEFELNVVPARSKRNYYKDTLHWGP